MCFIHCMKPFYSVVLEGPMFYSFEPCHTKTGLQIFVVVISRDNLGNGDHLVPKLGMWNRANSLALSGPCERAQFRYPLVSSP